MYNVYWGHGGILQRHLMGARKHNQCVHFDLDIDPTKLHLSQILFFRDLLEGVLMHNINEIIEGVGGFLLFFLVFIEVWIMLDTIQGPS